MASTTVANLTPFLLVGLAFFLFYRHPSSPLTLNMAQEISKSVHDFTVKFVMKSMIQDIRGNEVPLSSYKGKVLLIVNVASKCGLTESNYKELNILYQKYKNQDFEILAFPCNQFLWQEPGTNEEIQETIEVNGNNAAPLYKFLKSEKGGFLVDGIKWNFTKFLVNKEGKVIERYGPRTPPLEIEVSVKKNRTYFHFERHSKSATIIIFLRKKKNTNDEHLGI
ncbi:Glutathione peroxidase [Cynara cardunculus var. scolymus]|uniref:Glutathione peroxidase n=1 Tax=Cynara cardunculus var. scolymus TaxID=59895 RepID=A0A103XHQ5_CYNCS|nr:Glutathione peroxidase [Cynara cardunculus var. scolymus]